jgi:hypothetical protein
MYETLSDSELEFRHNAMIQEKERRQNLANIPGQVAMLSQRFIDGGGNPEDLVTVVG